MSSTGWYTLLVAAVAAERCVELVVSARHLRWARERGGVEHGAGHYPLMAAVHTLLLVSCVVEVDVAHRPFVPGPGLADARAWWSRPRGCAGGASARSARSGTPGSSSSPGSRWSSRGPYRWLRHPNYVAVVVEVAALPLVHTAWVTAVVFSLLDVVVLSDPDPGRAARPRGGRVSRLDVLVAGGGPVGLACAIEAARAGPVGGGGRAADGAGRQGVRRGPDARRGRGARPARRAPGRACRSAGSPTSARAARRATPSARDRAWGCGAPSCTGRCPSAPTRWACDDRRRRSTPWRRTAARSPSAGVSASWLLACDGLHSTVRRRARAGPRPVPARSRRYGLRRHAALAPWSDYVEVHWSPLRRGLRDPGRARPGRCRAAHLDQRAVRRPAAPGADAPVTVGGA